MEPNDLVVPVAEGVRLHVRHWSGTGAPVLLVHGLSSNARLWDGMAAALTAAGHPAYAVDLRSHGESDQPPEGYDTATAADDLAAVCAALDLPPVIAVGQSWGGNVVVALAATRPGVTRALALVDGGWIDLRGQFESWEACERALRPRELDGLSERALRAWIRGEHRDWGDWAVDATMATFSSWRHGYERAPGDHGFGRDRTHHDQTTSGDLRTGRRAARGAARHAIRLPGERR